ncbi:hypothetical protein EHQ68_06130 [Leptospira congkakensis]|uniref:Outer membrane protein beta-barrel domain-containing protein n=1 Tax=Leptospira congkakensis TaxID=2484932 RepID=A0A4Z1AD57_9LEPT|nr:hypothetical protein [Leptospira congkakensis]TGL90068.1 hypothetical protein EHQ68_06130 [Leptospira congkakensis]TGL93444.1 hypothetical protein EHQ70_17440 [Leptospira congkakensis]TGL97382.1 hypothetical protein EHQ69_00025 [Leptospira congkakensis]
MKQIKIYAILLAILLSQNQLLAQNIYNKKKFFVEVTAAHSFLIPNKNLHRIDDNVMNKNNDFYNRHEVIGDTTSLYGTQEQKFASFYTFQNSPKPKLKSQSFALFTEYLFSPKFGLGISLNNTNFQADNLSQTRFDNNLIYDNEKSFFGNPAIRENAILREILLPYNTKSNTKFLQLITIGIHLAYHFISHPIFDPFVRVGFGYGRNIEDMAIIYQSTLTAGSRFFLSESFYLLVEAMATNYDAYKVPDSTLFESKSKRMAHIWSIQEYSAKFGLGVAF